ncbi:hypothetical protein ACFL51_01090 [Myxococcota bacterium]
MLRATGLLSLGLILASASGCDPCKDMMCGACPSAITLTVQGEPSGVPVTEVTIDGFAGDCYEYEDTTTCNIGSSPGTYELTVDASGYAPQDLSITVPPSDGGCCDCGYDWVNETVTLIPD